MEINEGYIYVLVNPWMRDGLLKVGFTTRDPEQRAKELSASTGVPTEFVLAYKKRVLNASSVEKLIHERFSDFRVNEKREFFKMSLEDAIRIIDFISYTVSSLDIWQGRHKLEVNSTVHWTCNAKDYFLFTRYKNIFDPEPTIVDIWESRDDGDQIILTSKKVDKPEALISDGYLAEDMELLAGDRAVWIGMNRDHAYADQTNFLTSVLECRTRARVLAYSKRPRITMDGLPILFSALSTNKLPNFVRLAYEQVKKFGLPRVWSNE